MSSIVSTPENLITNQTPNAELLRGLRATRGRRYRAVPPAPVPLFCPLTSETGKKWAALPVRGWWVAAEAEPGVSRCVLGGLSEAEAKRRAEEANAGRGLARHLNS